MFELFFSNFLSRPIDEDFEYYMVIKLNIFSDSDFLF
jgi:hypothetical protein